MVRRGAEPAWSLALTDEQAFLVAISCVMNVGLMWQNEEEEEATARKES